MHSLLDNLVRNQVDSPLRSPAVDPLPSQALSRRINQLEAQLHSLHADHLVNLRVNQLRNPVVNPQ